MRPHEHHLLLPSPLWAAGKLAPFTGLFYRLCYDAVTLLLAYICDVRSSSVSIDAAWKLSIGIEGTQDAQ